MASYLASQGFDGPGAIVNQQTKKTTLSGVLGFGPGEGGGIGGHSAHLIGFLAFWFIGVASSLASQGFDGPRAIINQKTKKPTLSGVLGFGPGEGGEVGAF